MEKNAFFREFKILFFGMRVSGAPPVVCKGFVSIHFLNKTSILKFLPWRIDDLKNVENVPPGIEKTNKIISYLSC